MTPLIASNMHLSWIPTCQKASSSLLLAAAFSSGVAVYCVPTKCKEAVHVIPTAMAMTTSTTDQSRIAFLSFPNLPPLFAMMFLKNSRQHLMYGVMNVPHYMNKDGLEHPIDHSLSIDMICTQEISIEAILPDSDMLVVEPMMSVITDQNGCVNGIVPSSNLHPETQSLLPHPRIISISIPVASSPCGLTSMGYVHNDIENDNFLHVHSQLYWATGTNDVATPYLRHWLCVTKFGDRMGDRKQNAETSSISTGGASTEIVGEINVDMTSYFASAIPQRIVRSNTRNYCAIFFSPQIGSHIGDHKNMTLLSSYCIFNWDGGKCTVVDEGKGRDVLFVDQWSMDKFVLLDDEGEFLLMKKIQEKQDDSDTLNTRFRIFRPGSAYDERLSCERMFLLSSNKILFSVSRKSDHRALLLLGDDIGTLSTPTEHFIEGKKGKLWLTEGEKMISIIELPSLDKDRINVALATSSRILIIDCISSPTILATLQYENFGIYNSMTPLGSHCVSFLQRVSTTKSKIGYLSCIENNMSGTIANLGASHVNDQNIMTALRPDRVILTTVISEVCEQKYCLVKQPLTKPIFVLEPLCANIIASYSNSKDFDTSSSQRSNVSTLLERFGFFVNSNSTQENEGIGSRGVGITEKLLQMLRKHDLFDLIMKQLKSGKLTTPWISIKAKLDMTREYEDNLLIIADGDQHISEYLQNPAMNASCILPKPFDPLSHILSECSLELLANLKISDALKSMDFVGGSTASMDFSSLLLTETLFAERGGEEKFNNLNNANALSFTSTLKNIRDERRKQSEAGSLKRKLSIFSPSMNRNRCPTDRLSSEVIDYSVLDSMYPTVKSDVQSIPIFDETKHVWNSGPFEEKEEILLLDSVEEWTGRFRPTTLGKEGAEIVAESGQRTLQNILAEAEDNSNKEVHNEGNSQCSSLGGWDEKVGEGHSDEDKLTLYVRFSEGMDEDCKWKNEGIIYDLSSFQNKPKILHSDIFDIEATSSNVDEGESGSIKLLHDLVITRDMSDDEVAGLFVGVKRGSSLDIGMFHTNENQYRQRATFEFWFHLPKSDKEIVLVRRSLCIQNGEDLESLCCVEEKDGLMWELVAMPSGKLQFRSCGGDVIDSTSSSLTDLNDEGKRSMDDLDEDDPGLVSWPRENGYGGWNHVSLSFCCREVNEDQCRVTVGMRGIQVASSVVNMHLPTPTLNQNSSHDIDDLLSMSAIMFGLGASAGFRLTEMRVWAYLRPFPDIKRMMYEYLDAAKMKKKRFKVSIASRSNKRKSKGNTILPKPTTTSKILPAPPVNDSSRSRSRQNTSTTFFENESSFADFGSSMTQDNTIDAEEKEQEHGHVPNKSQSLFDVGSEIEEITEASMRESSQIARVGVEEYDLLSNDVKKSAAAALIRGGPAGRHFGGNRGGLPEMR